MVDMEGCMMNSAGDTAEKFSWDKAHPLLKKVCFYFFDIFVVTG